MAGKTFRTSSGDSNGGNYFVTISYENETTVKCTVTAGSYPDQVGIILYGFYIE